MKYKHILSVFYGAAALLIAYKSFITLNFTDAESGHITSKSHGIYFCFAVALFIILNAVFAYTLQRCPVKSPEIKLPLFLGSLPLLLSLILNTVFGALLNPVNNSYLNIALIVSGVGFAVFLVLYALNYFVRINLSKYVYVLPLLFWLVKLVSEYIKTAEMSFIAENGLKILSTALAALFFLYFAKYKGTVIGKSYHKITLLFGLSAAGICEIFAIPQIFSLLIKGYPAVNGMTIERNSIFELVLYAFTGLFILIYLQSFFSNSNLKRHHGSSQSKYILPFQEPSNTDNAQTDNTISGALENDPGNAEEE